MTVSPFSQIEWNTQSVKEHSIKKKPQTNEYNSYVKKECLLALWNESDFLGFVIKHYITRGIRTGENSITFSIDPVYFQLFTLK